MSSLKTPLLLLALVGCAPLAGLDENYYVRAGAGGAGVTGGAASLGGGGAGGVVGQAGTSSGLPLSLPPGRLAYHRFTKYSDGDSEMFVVDLPSGNITPELGQLFQLCGPLSGSFSPDGKRLAVAARPWSSPCLTGDAHRNELEIYVLDLENAPSKLRVTDNTVPDEDPVFSPSGDFLLVKHDNDVAKFALDALGLPHKNCDTLAPGSYCFKQDQEQSKPVVDSNGLVFFQQGTGTAADILYFNLRDAELSGTPATKPAAARADAYEARPNVFDSWLYFARWRSQTVKTSRIARKSLTELNQAEATANFQDDALYDYTDPCGMSGNLIAFVSNEGGGLHDLFVGDFVLGVKQNLDAWVPGLNSGKDELSPAFWAGAVP